MPGSRHIGTSKAGGSLFAAPAYYRVRVQGRLDNSWDQRMGHMRIVSGDAGNDLGVTCVEGRVSDQAELFGVLSTLHDLHFPLVSVELLEHVDCNDEGETS